MVTNLLEISILEFKKGAFITIENKKDSNHFYIIKRGKVKITKQFKIDPDEKDSILHAGHFIGIISCMSGHSREETAQAIENVSAIKIQRHQFKNLIDNNPNIAIKIIRSFSSKLRYIDTKMMTSHHSKEEEKMPDNEKLYKIGNFYYENQEYIKAYYAFYKYLQSGTDLQHKEEASKILESLSKYSKEALIHVDKEEEEATLITRNYTSNNIIFCENEVGKELFILKEGQVKITKIINNYEKIIAILKPGDIFGEMALLEDQVRSATAIAYDNISVMIVNKKNFEVMVKTQSKLATKMINILSERLWTGFRQLENKAIQYVPARILDILMLHLEKEKIKILRLPYKFNFGLKELMKMTDISLAEGKSFFNSIVKNKVLELSKDEKKITTPNLEHLQKEWMFEKNKAARKLEQASASKQKTNN